MFEIVRVRALGTVEDQHIAECVAVVDQFLVKTSCTRVLMDWRESVLALSTAARGNRLAALAAKAGQTRRVAMLYPQLGERQRKFREDVAAMGVDIGVFASEWQALDWLREGLARRSA
jgi:hypothetical protein